MFRVIGFPPRLTSFFSPCKGTFIGIIAPTFACWSPTIALMWGRRHVANVYRYLDAAHHRTRFNNFFLVERWEPEAALARRLRHGCASSIPAQGETIYVIIDDSKKAKRGQAMDAIAKMKDPRPRPISGVTSMFVASCSSGSTSSPVASGCMSSKSAVPRWASPSIKRPSWPPTSCGSSRPRRRQGHRVV